ncbi:MAG: PhnD/SsuA/transferrin family substrate-binding protein [Planctomycetes bacterium]|nr:PhnD/SsuA/transferrin family substrate-binding protein [Planctomycetota bacterium]
MASLLLAAAVSFAETQEDPTTVRLGVLAKRGSQRCLEKWGPTAEYLTATIPGYSFVVRPLSYGEVYTAVKQKEVNFILANPSRYVELESSLGASRIVTLKNLRPNGTHTTVFGGVIFRKADNKDIEHLEDLKGKTFMAVEETSFGGWQMAWRELKQQGIDPYRHFADLQFGGTHDAVVFAVRDGKVVCSLAVTAPRSHSRRTERVVGRAIAFFPATLYNVGIGFSTVPAKRNPSDIKEYMT